VSDVQVTTRLACETNSEQLVVAACRLVGTGNGVLSVRVLSPSRPTYDELWCYRESARVYHVRLSVDGTGMVTVRPERGAQE
jgi:hypothetical protein